MPIDGNPWVNKPEYQPEQVKEGTMLDQAAKPLSEKLELETHQSAALCTA